MTGSRGVPTNTRSPSSSLQQPSTPSSVYPTDNLEGVINKLAELHPELESSDYTNLYKRMKDLELEQLPLDTDEPIIVALDSTGFKVTDRGEWLREKHGKTRKGWLKIHVAVNVETCELINFEVTDETVHDSQVVENLIDDIELENFLGDGAYDTHQTFQLVQKQMNVKDPPGIKTRKNSVVTGNTPRDRAVKEQHELGYEKWKEKQNYGKRWTAETFFSNLKRLSGETLRAKTPETAVKEVERKLQIYSIVTKMAKTA